MADALIPIEPELLVGTFTSKGRILFRNQAWTNALGEDHLPWKRLSSDDQELVRACLLQALEGKLVTNQLIFSHHPLRDEPLPILLNLLPVPSDKSSTPTSVQAITITGEVLAEPKSWTESQTYRHRTETLGRMTMGITHDFNNQLEIILGHLQLIRVEEAPGETIVEHLRTIEQAAQDGAALIRKIQAYIRQEQLAVLEAVDLPGLLQDCITLTRPYWYNETRRQGIDIEVQRSFDEVPPIQGVAAELRDVFVNFILNAVQAMPEGGILSFSSRLDPVRGVEVRVEDTGIGMSESVRARIFDPLFTTKGEHGTGMGMAVAYGTVRKHKGSIDVETSLGKGTRFIITFPPATAVPIQETLAAEPARPLPAAETNSSARLLLVDDNPTVRATYARMFSFLKHEVTLAASGKEALDLLAHTTFDVIFTDQGMPEMSGRQLAKVVRDRFPSLPIVLLTGDTDVGKPDEQVDVVLYKPTTLPDLKATVERLLSAGASG